MSYRIFKRHWWKANPDWPNGLEPEAGPKTTVAYADHGDEARKLCHYHNADRSAQQIRFGIKYEFERV